MAASADLDRVKIWQDLEIASGGRMDVNGDWYLGGTKVNATAAELNAFYALGLVAAELGVLDGVTAGTAAASKAVVLDASKDCIGLGRLTQGAFSSATQGSGLALNPTYTAALRTYADDAGAALTPSGAVSDLRVTLGRYLVTANQSAVNIRVWGSMGQVKVYDALVNGEQIGGVNGRLEVVQSAGTTTLAGYGVSAGVCGIFATAGTTLINTNHVAAGVAAIADIKGTCTQTGVVAGFYVGKYDTTNWSDATTRASFGIGLYMPVGSVNQGIRIGHWAGSGAAGSAIPISAVTDSADTTQRNIVAVYGESTADLGSGIHANVGRFRHLVSATVASTDINHETYGLVGQLCCKSVELKHMHAGLMGTFEGTAAGVIANSAYTYGAAAIIARIGGGANIVATKCLCGVSSILNGAAVASGTSSAFACDATSTDDWDYGMSLANCTRAFNFVGACVDAKQAGAIDSTHSILIHVDGQPYAIPVHAVGA